MTELIPCCLFRRPVYSFVMKTLLRSLLYLALMVWLGAEVFFPITAAVAFGTLRPDTHAAGMIVRQLLTILHGMGLVSGLVAMALLALAPAWGIYKVQSVLAPMGLVILMIALTVYSQFGITPAMERDRIAAGGAIDTAAESNPGRIHFKKLHDRSERLEAAIILMGLATVVLVAGAETARL